MGVAVEKRGSDLGERCVCGVVKPWLGGSNASVRRAGDNFMMKLLGALLSSHHC